MLLPMARFCCSAFRPNNPDGMVVSVLQSILRACLDFFLPGFCLFCRQPRPLGAEDLACPRCQGEIKLISRPFCSVCGAPFRDPANREDRCLECIKQPPPFHRARAAAFYEGRVLDAIHRLKYQRQLIYARFLGQLLANSPAGELAAGADLLVPVPLHSRRLRTRGFNQALLLARTFAKVPLAPEALVRRRATQPQLRLSPEERQANVRGAFWVPDPAAVAGKTVVLIDDVYTTGATAQECARVLLQAGAGRVEVLTVARVGYA